MLPSPTNVAFTTAALLLRAPAALLLVVTGCGAPAPAESQSLVFAAPAAEVLAAVDTAATTASVLTGLDLSSNMSRGSLDAASGAMNLLLGSCVRASTMPAPAVGLAVAFAPGGCGLPLTPVRFMGGFSLSLTSEGGAGSASLFFHQLFVGDTYLNGGLGLRAGEGGSDWTASALHVDSPVGAADLDGQGSLAVDSLARTVAWSGRGQLAGGADRFGFEADGVGRGLGDCYPSSGRLTLTHDAGDGVVHTLTIAFDGGTRNTGHTLATLDGVEIAFDLPARTCAAR